MAGVLLGLLGILIQLGMLAGIILLVVRLVSGKKKSSTQSAALTMRRLFVYGIMLVMLVLVAIGIAGLIDAALPSSDVLVDDNAAAARSIAFVIVGMPVYIGLGVYSHRKLRDDEEERRSLAWAIYSTIALTGSLVAWMALVNGALASAIGDNGADRMAVISAVVWFAVWIGHWIVVDRYEPRLPAVHLLLGSATGLIWTSVGLAVTATAALSTVYDSLFRDTLISGGIEEIATPASALLVGAPVWWWYWLRKARHGERIGLWHAYVLLLGVLGGAVTAIVGAGTALFTVLNWLIGSSSESTVSQFSAMPGAVAAIGVGVGVWWYHGWILGTRGAKEPTEIDRVYDYLLAAAGLVVAAAGLSVLITVLLTSVFESSVIGGGDRESVAVAITLLVVGAPIWLRYWLVIQHRRVRDAVAEVQSVTRRIYIIGIFGIASIVAIVSLMILAFIIFEDLLDGDLGGATIADAAVPVALLFSAGTVSWYHFVVFRSDRTVEIPDRVEAVEGQVLELSRTLPTFVLAGELEEMLAQLFASGVDRVAVRHSQDGYVVEHGVENGNDM